jgi:hypothetical protein
VELFLRLYLGAKLHAESSFPATDRRPLGALIDEAERSGFDSRVIAQLREFNDDRIKSLHHYLLGATSYASLKDVCDRSAALTQKVVKVIADQFGELA